MPAILMNYVLIVWLAVLAALVGYRLLNGEINLRGLMTHDGGNLSPERAQLLAATVVGVIAYAQQALAHHAMVDPPGYLLTGMAASHLFYLGGKSVRQFVSD